MSTQTDEDGTQNGSVTAKVTRRDIKICDARCPKDEEHALQALREFRSDFPGEIGRRSGVIFCSDEVEIYCYRTDTQLVADVQKSAVQRPTLT